MRKFFIPLLIGLGMVVLAQPAGAGANSALPFDDNFETYTDGTPLNTGSNGWYGSSSSIIVLSAAAMAPAGSTNIVMIPTDCALSNRFAGLPSANVWIQMDVCPSLYNGVNFPIVDTNQAVMFYINSNGNFVVHNGPASPNAANSTNWVTLANVNAGTSETNWVTIGIYENYNAGTWDLYANNTLATNNIGFINPVLTNFNGFNVYNGSSTNHLDNIAVIYGGGAIGLSTTALAYAVTYGASPANQTLVMMNSGKPGFTYTNTVTYGAGASGWLAVTPVTGEIGIDGNQALTGMVNSASLAAGVYTATNTIMSSATNSPQILVTMLTVNKATPTVVNMPTAMSIIYGQMLSDSTLSGGTGSVAGVFTFTTPATVPTSGVYSATVTFTPTDTNNYETLVMGSVDVTVNKTEPHAVASIYIIPAITDEAILPESSMLHQYLENMVSKTISLVAAPGEYEPASFAVHANDDINSLTIETTNLTGSAGMISSNNIDVRVVKCWYQAGYSCWNEAAKYKHLTPELLLKDDSLVTVTNMENYLKLSGEYIWISDTNGIPGIPAKPTITQFPVQDTATLQPVHIPNTINKQFWVTVKVPDDCAAGVYEGTIKLQNSGTLIEELPVKLEVLPFALSAPGLIYSLYDDDTKLSATGTISRMEKNETQFTAEQENLFNHGVRNTAINGQDNYDILGQVLTIRNAAGMSNQPLYYVGYPTIYGYGTNYDALKTEVSNLINFVVSYGATELYIYGPDETYLNTPVYRAQMNAVHEAGAKVFDAQNQSYANDVADILDLAVVSWSPDISLAAKYHSYTNEIFSYENPQVGEEKPEKYRRNYGLLLWQKNYDGAMDYAYHGGASNIWNDFDHPTFRDLNFVYPTVDGVIDTIQWEGWREGVDDVRYLTALYNAIAWAQSQTNNTSQAEDWLEDLENSDLTVLDLNAVRSRMIGYILYYGGGLPPDTNTPHIVSLTHSPVSSSLGIDISWGTDERTTAQVEYGLTPELGSATEVDLSLLYAHIVTLTGLDADTNYYVRARSKDSSGNEAISDTYSFSTATSLTTNSDMTIFFVQPTASNNAVINTNQTEISYSVAGTHEGSSFIDFNKSLVAYWNLNEACGATAHDKSTYTNTATLVNMNTNTCWVNGVYGRALHLDGVDDYVSCTSNPSMNCTNAITLEAWVRPESVKSNNYECIIIKNAPENTSMHTLYALWIGWSDRRIAFYIWTESSAYEFWSRNEIPLDEWSHVVGTYDSDAGIGRIYINGRLDCEYVNTYKGKLRTNSQPLCLGRPISPGYYYFDGYIDEARVWSRALPADEVCASYNAGVNGLREFDPSLVAWWNLDETTGTTAHDASTYTNNLSLENMDTNACWASGTYGGALRFDGADDYAHRASSSSLNITNAITMEAWIKPEAVEGTNYEYIIRKTAAEPAQSTLYGMSIDADDRRICMYLWSEEYDEARGFCSVNEIPLHVWTHVAVTYDSTTGKARIYINGSLDSEDGSVLQGKIRTNSEPLYLGYHCGSGHNFNGVIDEARIWNRALSADEIYSSYKENMDMDGRKITGKLTGLIGGTYSYHAYYTDLTGNSTQTETRTISYVP